MSKDIDNQLSKLCQQKLTRAPMKASEEIQKKFGLKTRERIAAVTIDSGQVYEGQWLNGLRDGSGTNEWPDGSRYAGQYIQGK